MSLMLAIIGILALICGVSGFILLVIATVFRKAAMGAVKILFPGRGDSP